MPRIIHIITFSQGGNGEGGEVRYLLRMELTDVSNTVFYLYVCHVRYIFDQYVVSRS